jgi:hypothetical protein
MNLKRYGLLGMFLLTALVAGCQPQTPAEKAQDKIEDAAHETSQGMERAGEKVKDAVN